MTEFKGDKRSKAYKEWKKNHAESTKGLGDAVEKFTEATGIKALLSIYNRVFNDRRELTGCNSCFLNGVWKKLERVFNEYK